jgi:hypothetical protein
MAELSWFMIDTSDSFCVSCVKVQCSSTGIRNVTSVSAR